MKCFFPFLFVLSAMFLPASEPPAVADKAEIPYAKLGFKEDIYLWEGKPYTGTAMERHPNGKLSLLYSFIGGKLHGRISEWYEDGIPKTSTHFKEGKRHGPSTYWHPDGSVMKEQLYEEDVLKEDKHFEKGEKK